MIDSDKAAGNRKAREEKKRAHLQAMMDRYRQQFRAIAGIDAPGVAREVHGTIELFLERDLKRSPEPGIRCSKGCSHSCRGPVEILPHEAALLAAEVRAGGVTIDAERLERQGNCTVETWRQQPAGDRACVFLGEDGACRVYEARPSACRKLLVTGAPELCDQDQHTPEAVERWFSWEAEVFTTAAQETFGCGLLPVLLAGELARPQPL